MPATPYLHKMREKREVLLVAPGEDRAHHQERRLPVLEAVAPPARVEEAVADSPTRKQPWRLVLLGSGLLVLLRQAGLPRGAQTASGLKDTTAPKPYKRHSQKEKERRGRNEGPLKRDCPERSCGAPIAGLR